MKKDWSCKIGSSVILELGSSAGTIKIRGKVLSMAGDDTLMHYDIGNDAGYIYAEAVRYLTDPGSSMVRFEDKFWPLIAMYLDL